VTPPAAPRPALRLWAVVAAAALAAPVLAALPPAVPEPLRGALMAAFAPLCHQLPARSFAAGGVAFALCHRCFGVALGLALGVLLAPLGPPRPGPDDGRRGLRLLALAALPMGLDWALDALGVWTNVPASRVATGLAFGAAAGVLLGRAVAWGRRPAS